MSSYCLFNNLIELIMLRGFWRGLQIMFRFRLGGGERAITVGLCVLFLFVLVLSNYQ